MWARPAADRGDLLGRRAHEQGAVAVEVGLALVPVVRVALADPLRPLDVRDEREGPRAHDVRLVPVLVLRQDVGLVDPVPGRGEVQQQGRLGPLQAKAHRVRVGRLHHLHRGVGVLAQRLDPRGREDDPVVGGLDVLRRHLAAVVELHALVELEGVDQAVLGDRPGFGQVTDRLRPGLVERIHPHQRVVVRRGRVDEPEGLLLVRVVGGRLRGHHEHELAAIARLVLGEGGRSPAGRHQERESDESRDEPHGPMAHEPPPR